MDLRLEKRISPRRNTMISAHIVFEGGRRQIECVIRNLSDGGAKLEVASVRGIPDQFQLLVPQHRPQQCRVVWRAVREMGVQFLH